jgi:hypothetical protein
MTESEYAEYKEHSDAYFGQISNPTKSTEDPYELFTVILDVYKNNPRVKLLELLRMEDDIRTRELSSEQLACMYAEGIVASIMSQQSKKAE